jgi:RNA polymerase sigma factor (sigma-70 family)
MIPLAACLSRHLPHLREPRSDGELLAAFLADRDEDAFSELVRRHGPLVWSVCRRSLPDAADAEDAFQTSFLVLVRRARRLRSRDTLGPWLYQVAVWTARNIRRRNARIHAKRQPLGEPPGQVASPDQRIDVDEALAALPEKYRTPLVLCHLQGWSRREAAERLGCPEGTLSSLLARGLDRLRAKLGGDPAKALIVSAPALPALLANSTVKAAAGMHLAASATVHQLVEGVVRMFWIKKATAASVALLAIFGFGMGIGVSVKQVPGAVAGDGSAAVAASSDEAKLRLEVAEAEALRAEAELAAATKKGDDAHVLAARTKWEAAKAALEKIRRVSDNKNRITGLLDEQDREGDRSKYKKQLDQLAAQRERLDAKLKAAKAHIDEAPTETARKEKLDQIAALAAELKAVDLDIARIRTALELMSLDLMENAWDRAQIELEARIEKLRAEQAQLQAEAEKLALTQQWKQRELELKQRELLEAERAKAAKPVKPVEAQPIAAGTLDITVTPSSFKVVETRADGKVIGTATFDTLAILTKYLNRTGKDPKAPRAVRLTMYPETNFEVIKAIVEACAEAGLKPPTTLNLSKEKADLTREYDDMIKNSYRFKERAKP